MQIINTLIFLLCFFSTAGYADEDFVKWDCKKPPLEFLDDSNTCEMYILENNSRVIITDMPAAKMLNTTITYYSNNLINYAINYGGGSQASIFYELSTKRFSENCDPVYLIDITHNLAVVGNEEGVIFTSLFKEKNPVKQILIPYSDIFQDSSSSPDTVQVKFKDNKVYIDYQDKNQRPQHKVFELQGFTPTDKPAVKN